jgi:hypothetical protein
MQNKVLKVKRRLNEVLKVERCGVVQVLPGGLLYNTCAHLLPSGEQQM